MYRILVKWALRRADLVTSMAEHMTTFMNERGYSTPEKIVTLPFGVNTDQFNPGCRLNLRHGDFLATVISTRNLDDVYDVETFVRATPLVKKEYPFVRFIIVGDGPLRKSLEDLALSLKMNNYIEFLGKVAYEDMPGLLGNSDVFVTTSTSDGNNVSLNEAMACGAFPVVSDIPANREWVVHRKNGFVFPCGNVESLAQRIIEALQQKETRNAAAAENWAITKQRGSWANNMDRMENFYRKNVR